MRKKTHTVVFFREYFPNRKKNKLHHHHLSIFKIKILPSVTTTTTTLPKIFNQKFFQCRLLVGCYCFYENSGIWNMYEHWKWFSFFLSFASIISISITYLTHARTHGQNDFHFHIVRNAKRERENQNKYLVDQS